MSNPISILIPIYNGIEFLNQSLSSVIQQTYKNWEVIIGINGHSPDSTIEKKAIEVVSQLNKNNNFDIRIIYYNTNGKPATLNKMVIDTKYNFIALIDVDDLWICDKLQKQLPYLDIYDVIGTGCRYFGDTNHKPILPFGDLRYFNFFQFNPIINSSSIIRKDLCFWNDRWIVEDYDLWLRLWKKNYKFYNVPTIEVLHRIHKKSAFNSNGNDNNVPALLEWHRTH